MPNIRIHNAAAALFCLFTVSAWADTLTVNTADRGYYYDADFRDSTNKNYLTGQINTGSNANRIPQLFRL